MRVLVWGLGYVGTVTAACLAELGHHVVGVEPNTRKVALLNAGKSPVKEPELDGYVERAVAEGRLRAVTEGISLIAEADVSLICVGTPSAADGSPVQDFIQSVAFDIGQGLKASSSYHVVILRSTVFPGMTRSFLEPLLEEHSGRKAGVDFGLVMNPEFLRETSAVADFHDPPYTVLGQRDTRSGDVAQQLYETLDAPVYRVAIEEAELLKLCNNAFHALKIGFANEIGRVCDRLEIDSHRVMEMVCADAKLNISPAYLKPGFAFGGSCLPKDLRSLTFHGRKLGLELPILNSVLPSNTLQIEAARVKVHALGVRAVGILGLSFKAGTDDLRESPILSFIRDLWQDGFDVCVYDPDVQLDLMLGANRAYLERQLPQIHQIFCSRIEEVLERSEVVVVSQHRPQFIEAVQHLEGRAIVLDLVRLSSDLDDFNRESYRGLSW